MFHYLHSYMPETWEAQVKCGLIDENAGIRYSQSLDIPEELKFNNLAAKGGALYELVREMQCPLYIDRLQGGCYIEDYPYDMELVRAYRELLGDHFWGFQMHEWMSNYRNDLRKLERGNCPEWTEEAITETIRQMYQMPHIFLEAMNAKEFAESGNPATLEAFLKNSEELYAKRQRYTDGMLLPCDSGFLAYPLELRMGTKRFMPEIGAQTPDARIQVAFARGMSKACGVPFGTYYEPWGGKPFSSCCYHREGKNEWNIGGDNFPFETMGENGGSSRSLQRRLHLYSYMAGASFMAEEWGMCNTFYDWVDFDLSPYGMVKRDFIRFTQRYPDIGEPITPIAVVLPKEFPVFQLHAFDSDEYLGYPVEESLRTKLVALRKGVWQLFCQSSPMVGVETRILRNCVVPDALDMVQEDVLQADQYQYLVDLTGSESFRQKYAERICDIEQVQKLLDESLPCVIRGNAMKQLTRRKDGTVFLMLTNNSGVERTVADGETQIPSAAETVTVQVRDGRQLHALEGDGTVSCAGGVYHVQIPAGGWFFGRIG